MQVGTAFQVGTAIQVCSSDLVRFALQKRGRRFAFPKYRKFAVEFHLRRIQILAVLLEYRKDCNEIPISRLELPF